MQTIVRERAGIQILMLRGRMMGGPETDDLKATVKRLLDANHTRFLIDMRGVDWLNSSGLGALICTYVHVTKAGGMIAFTGIRKVQEVIEMTCVHEVIDVFESTEEAVAWLLAENYSI